MKIKLSVSSLAKDTLEKEERKTTAGQVLSLVMTGTKAEDVFPLILGWYGKSEVEDLIVRVGSVDVAFGIADTAIDFENLLFLDLEKYGEHFVLREAAGDFFDSVCMVEVPVQATARLQ